MTIQLWWHFSCGDILVQENFSFGDISVLGTFQFLWLISLDDISVLLMFQFCLHFSFYDVSVLWHFSFYHISGWFWHPLPWRTNNQTNDWTNNTSNIVPLKKFQSMAVLGDIWSLAIICCLEKKKSVPGLKNDIK